MALVMSTFAVPTEGTAGQTTPHLLDTTQAGPAAIRGGAMRLAAYVAGTALGVTSSALLFRHLGVVDTGRYSIAIALVAIVAGVSDFGLTAIGVRELSVHAGSERDSIARQLLGLRLATSVVGVVAIVGFAAIAGYGATLVLGVTLAGIGLMLQSAQSTLVMGLISELKLGWVAAFEFLRAVLGAALVVGLIVAKAHLLAFLAVTIPVGAVVFVVNVWISHGSIPLTPAFYPREWWALVRDVFPYSIAVAAATVYFYLAIVLVSLLANGKTLGYFSVSVRVIQVLLVMPGIAVGAAFPIFARAARDDRARLSYALDRVFEVSLIVGVLVALCLAVGSHIAIDVVGGRKFAAAAPLLAIQGVGLGASFVGAVWANGLLSLQRYREILLISLFALLLGGALVALLVSIDGARGASIATAGDEFVLALLSGWALVRADRSLKPPLRIAPKVAAAAAGAAATTLIDLPAVGSVMLAAATYLVVLLALGAVPAELIEQLPWRRPVHH